jgi:hypothetical protein
LSRGRRNATYSLTPIYADIHDDFMFAPYIIVHIPNGNHHCCIFTAPPLPGRSAQTRNHLFHRRGPSVRGFPPGHTIEAFHSTATHPTLRQSSNHKKVPWSLQSSYNTRLCPKREVGMWVTLRGHWASLHPTRLTIRKERSSFQPVTDPKSASLENPLFSSGHTQSCTEITRVSRERGVGG